MQWYRIPEGEICPPENGSTQKIGTDTDRMRTEVERGEVGAVWTDASLRVIMTTFCCHCVFYTEKL